jgi:hypothetical protein
VSLAPAEGLPMSCDESIADIGIGGDPVIGTTHIDAWPPSRPTRNPGHRDDP